MQKKKTDNDIESEPIESNEKFSDSDFDYCKLEEIIQNNCFEDITSDKAKEVYSYIKSNLINNDNDYILIKTDNVIYQVSSVKHQMNSNSKYISNIDLGECEERLENTYNISESNDLIIFQINIKDLEKTKTYVQYEIYHPNTLQQLKLDISKIFQ